MKTSTNEKLSPKYFGPIKVIDIVGKWLISSSYMKLKFTLFFHIPQLKQCRYDLPDITHIPAL